MAWLKRNLKQLIATLLPMLLFAAAGFWVSDYLLQRQQQQNQLRVQQSLEAKANQLADAIAEKMTIYQYGLRGVRGAVLSAGAENFRYANILAYSQSRDLATEFPGARGFGIIRKVTPDGLPQFLVEAEAENGDAFSFRQLKSHPMICL